MQISERLSTTYIYDLLIQKLHVLLDILKYCWNCLSSNVGITFFT